MIQWQWPHYLAVCLLGFSGTVAAGSDLPVPVGPETRSVLEKSELALADLLRLAELENPALASARSGVRAWEGRTTQAGVYPNPVFELEVEDFDPDRPGDRKEKVSLALPLVVTQRRGNAAAAARFQRDAALHTVERTRREVHGRVHALWASTLYLREAEDLLARLTAIAARTEEIAETRHEMRAAPESHSIRASFEVRDLESLAQRLERERVGVAAELVALFGGIDLPADRIAGSLDADPYAESLPDPDLDAHPSTRAAASRVAAAEAVVRHARSERFEDLGLFVSVGRDRASDSGFLEAGVSVPLPLFDRNQGRVAESRAMLEAAQSDARMTLSAIEAELTEARAAYRTLRQELRISNEHLVPASREALEQAQEGFRTGRTPFLELLDAQRTHAGAALRNLELRRNVAMARSELLRLLGFGPHETKEDQDANP